MKLYPNETGLFGNLSEAYITIHALYNHTMQLERMEGPYHGTF